MPDNDRLHDALILDRRRQFFESFLMHVGSRLILTALNEIYGYVLEIPIPVRCRTVDLVCDGSVSRGRPPSRFAIVCELPEKVAHRALCRVFFIVHCVVSPEGKPDV